MSRERVVGCVAATVDSRKKAKRVSQCLPEGAPQQFVPSFAQSSLIKEKLKLCRRSYYCLEQPSPASLAPSLATRLALT